MFLIIVIGRMIAVFVTFYSSRLCCKRRTINFRELCFITYGGMIRGAIAFALVLKLPECTPSSSADDSCFSSQIYDLFVSTTLIIVMLTTLIFGTFMGRVQILLCPPTDKDRKELRAYSQIGADALKLSMVGTLRKSMIAPKERAVSHYEVIVHPNEENEVEDVLRRSMFEQPGF